MTYARRVDADEDPVRPNLAERWLTPLPFAARLGVVIVLVAFLVALPFLLFYWAG